MLGRGLHLGWFCIHYKRYKVLMFYGSKPMFFRHVHFNFFDNTLTLFCWLMVFAHWLTSLLLIPFEQTWYHKQLFFVGWMCHWWLKWRVDFITIITNVFLFLAIKVLDVFISKLTIFFINVLTWCGQQRVLETFFYQCYIHFINKECQWQYKDRMPPLFWNKLLIAKEDFSQLGVLMGLL
jgi:hypothetical protein